jgi:hypothetical protein
VETFDPAVVELAGRILPVVRDRGRAVAQARATLVVQAARRDPVRAISVARGLRVEADQVLGISVAQESRAEVGPVRAEDVRHRANSMTFWEWLVLDLRAAQQRAPSLRIDQAPASDLARLIGPAKLGLDRMAVAFNARLRIGRAPVRDRTAVVCSGHFLIGLVKVHGLVRTAVVFNALRPDPLGLEKVHGPDRMAAGYSGLRPDPLGPVKMAAAYNVRGFALTAVRTFDRIGRACVPTGRSTSATSTLTTTITSSTRARRGTI